MIPSATLFAKYAKWGTRPNPREEPSAWNITTRFEMSSMWSILWNRFHICKSFKSCWIKSCYTPPTKPRSALRRNRSALVRDALREHLRRLELRASEERDRQGYSRHSQADAEARALGIGGHVAGRIAEADRPR